MNHNDSNLQNIPPSAIEAEIASPGSTDVRVILNQEGNVITIVSGGK